MRWGDLVEEGAIPVLLWESLAPTWQSVYLQKVADTLALYDSGAKYTGPELGGWAGSRTSRRTLLYMQH